MVETATHTHIHTASSLASVDVESQTHEHLRAVVHEFEDANPSIGSQLLSTLFNCGNAVNRRHP